MEYVGNPRGEGLFEGKFRETCALMGVAYIKIEDPKIDKDRYKAIKSSREKSSGFEKEPKRPFDGLIITRMGNFAAEFKYNKNGLERHQKDNQELIDSINNGFFVIRQTVTFELISDKPGYCTPPKATYYIEKRIDNRLRKIYVSEDMENIVKWFCGEVDGVENSLRSIVTWVK